MSSLIRLSASHSRWRLAVLFAFVLGSLTVFVFLSPILQDPSHNLFADRRVLFGLPNALNVLSNLSFLMVGMVGIQMVLKSERTVVSSGWKVLFLGVALVSMGSSYYHWDPTNESLMWDRLPLTIGFMGFFVALVGEYAGRRYAKKMLIPAILIGISSVVYWRLTNDLRFYIWVQYMPMGAILLTLALFRSKYSHSYMMGVALVWYLIGKFFEANDAAVFQFLQHFASGHTIKHLLAATACYTLIVYFRKRTPRPAEHDVVRTG